MKKITAIILLSWMVIACNSKPIHYPNVDNNQIITQLNWGMNYSSTAKVFTDNFKLDFSRELEQGKKNESARVYEFSGGKYNNINTAKWVSAFENDSLQFITIMLAESEKANDYFFNVLTEKFNTDHISLDNSAGDEQRWHIEKAGKNIALVMLNKDGVVLISKPFLEN
ncbi:MAG: hypothetical protein HND52_11255 [Ignavibacteriae bacterium]|jgi:hypothetical protein|nr:hypothetical protein [Ignavibacteriota bacterium]NOG98525.1 hypothetical protein [Ignavibacteriota bacterium]